MKKLWSIFLVFALSLALTGCGTTSKNDQGQGGKESGIAKIGLGHITSIASSKEMEGDVTPVGQVDTVMAAVAFDKDGKVVKVTIDTAQTKVAFNKDMQLTSDVNAEGQTKVELGDNYGMKKASSIGKEWYEQIAELEKWMIGKTVDEIKAMKTSETGVPEVAELTSSVTIKVKDYIAAVEEAYKTAVEASGAEKIGLGHVVSAASSKSLNKTKNVLPLAQVDTIMAATAFDKDGKVVKTIIDNAQTKINFDENGKLTTDKNGEFKTKVELGDAYGMKKASSIGKEWYEQIAELGKWMEGKTVEEIKAMKTVERDASHPAVPDEAELKSSVTISVQDYIAAVAEAYSNAK